MRYHVCPLALLKVTKLCPCSSYFSGIFGNLESLAVFERGGGGGGQTLHESSQAASFSQFFKGAIIK